MNFQLEDYAGPWLRFVAFIIDSIILSIIYLLLIIPVYDAIWPAARYRTETILAFDGGGLLAPEPTTPFSTMDFSFLILLGVGFMYYTCMEASRYQASVGKLALELNVADMDGARLPFIKAMLRNLTKVFSVLPLFAGYLVAAFHIRHQAWHDMIAGAVVLKK